MQSKRLFWTCPHCGREVVWENGPYILQNGTEFFCPYCDGGTIISMQKGKAAQQCVHPTVATVAAQEVESDARNSG